MEYTRLLKKGASGDDVLAAKKQLLTLGYYTGVTKVVSKTFGADTVKAVKSFQAQVGLTVDGIIGENTWTALFEQVPDEEVSSSPESTGSVSPSAKALAIVSLALARIGDIYVWGGSGMTDISDAAIKERDSEYARAVKFRDKQYKYGFTGLMGHDCSGFISWLLREAKVWNDRRDCDKLWALCKEVSRANLIPGDLVFRVSSTNSDDETHIGLYCGRGIVVHAKGRDVGVVLEGINQNGTSYWHKCGRFKLLYE